MMLPRIIAPAETRFWRKVDATAGIFECWPWLAGLTTKGYGGFTLGDRRRVLAHRFAYELLIGAVPAGMELDHTCRNRACVNPVHLEPVTHLENVRRGDAGRYKRELTHCKHGHELSGGNLIVRPEGWRHCRTCRNEAARRRSKWKHVA